MANKIYDDGRNFDEIYDKNKIRRQESERIMRLRAQLVHGHNNPWEYSDLKPEDIHQPAGEIFDE